jgi:hypothetical protein
VQAFDVALAAGQAKRFKSFALGALGLEGSSATDLIDLALASWDGVVPDLHPLSRSINEMVACVTERPGPVSQTT